MREEDKSDYTFRIIFFVAAICIGVYFFGREYAVTGIVVGAIVGYMLTGK